MKKIRLYSVLCAASLLVFSCKKDDDKVTPVDNSGNPIVIEYPTEFSGLTPAQHKSSLESNGIELLNNLKDLQNTKSLDASANLIDLIDRSGFSAVGKSSSVSILKALHNIRTGKGSAGDVFSAMRLKGSKEEELESIQQFFDENAGTYTWVKSNEDWDYVKGGKNLIFKFPSTENGATNNAILTISDYEGKILSSPIDGYSGDLPVKLLMELKVDNVKTLGFDFKAAYNTAGEPTSMEVVLSVDAYSFTTKVINNTQTASFEQFFKKGTVVLMAMGTSTKGDFGSSTIENSEGFEDVIHEASAYFQLMNLKLSGTVDAKNFGSELNKMVNRTAEKEVALYNKYIKLYAGYADSNKKIADTEFYHTTKTETWEYDSTGDGINDASYTDEYTAIDIRLIFSDGSKSDLEAYTNTGFETFKSELEDFFAAFE